MKRLLLSLFLAALPLTSFAASGTAIPGGTQAAPFIIEKPGAYYLAANRTMTKLNAWAAIEIKADNVTLDLNGFTLGFSSSASQNGFGKGIAVTGDNVEIRNGVISTTPATAIHAESGDYLRLIDLRVMETGGVYASGRAPVVERCDISETRGTALWVGRGGVARNCIISEVEVLGGGLGGTGLEVGPDATAEGCIIEHTDGPGIYALHWALIKDTRVANANRGKYPSAAGIVLGSSDATIRGCLINRSYGCGILIRPIATGTVIEGTVVRGSAAAAPTIGAGIVSQNNSTTLRNNQGVFNQGGFIAGQYVDAGGNTGT